MKKFIFMASVLVGMSYLAAQDYQVFEYQNEKIKQTEKYLKGNDFQKDFLLFMELLQSTHPAFAPEQKPPFNIDSLTKTGYQYLETCYSLFDFQLLLLSIIAPLHDGHTFIDFFQADDLKMLYPMNVKVTEHVPYIHAIEKEYEEALGKQIVSINGLSIEDVYHNFGKITISDNNNSLENKIFEYGLILVPKVWDFLFQRTNDSLLQLTFHDGTSIHIKAKHKSEIKDMVKLTVNNQNSDIMHNKEIPFHYTVLEKEGMAYLQFNKCIDQNTIRYYYDNMGYADENGIFPSEIEEQIQQYQKFDTLLNAMFNEIKLKKITTLVIDVRNNGGGNSALCQQLLSYLFLDMDNFKTINSIIRISDFFVQYYPEMYDLMCKIYPHKIEIGKLYNVATFSIDDSTAQENLMKKYFPMNKDSSLVFSGATIFIQGKDTFSSAGDLLIEARDNQIGMIIGENSAYKPCCYGDILFWKLPNTETTGGISHKVFIRPDKSKCNEDFLAPNVYISKTFENYKKNIDPCWEWVKNVYLQDEQY
jgi:hypothetical protein